MRCLAFALSLIMPVAASAAEITECDWRASAANLAEPWEDQTRSFANGNVRLALLDTIEPALAPFHILILSPPYDTLGDRQCRILSAVGTLGFSGLDLADLEVTYVPGKGLHFTLPAIRYDGEIHTSLMVHFVLNQATGEITVTEDIAAQ